MKKGFWSKFDELMDSLPEYVNNEIEIAQSGSNMIIGNNNSSIKQSSAFGSSSSTIVQGGNKIKITTKNGKTTIKVNGKEYVEKKDA